jgi:hypothetical protein
MRDVGTLASATPETRDRYVDFLRAASICAVVLGHWLIGVVHVENGLVYLTSAVGVTRGLWLGTWLLQVMPIFFFVGGFSNLVTYESYRRRGLGAGAFVRSRVARLLRPSVVFLGAWAVVQIGLHLADAGRPAGARLWGETTLLRGVLPPAQTLPFGPLWFLGFYLLVVMASPGLIALHRRCGLWVPVVMAVTAVVVDAVGFGAGLHGVRYVNVVPVLLFPHQLGFFYADGRIGGRRLNAGMVAIGLGGLVLLTTPWVFRLFGEVRFEWFPGIGYYPKSLTGTGVEAISNAYPPTVCFLLGGVWMIGAAMSLRAPAGRWLQRPGAWEATIFGNAVIMTGVPVAHDRVPDRDLRALAARDRPRGGRDRPLVARAPAVDRRSGVILAGMVAVLSRFERRR